MTTVSSRSQSMITFAYPEREHEALGESIEQAALDVLRSGKYILGDTVQQFERALACYTEMPHAIGVSSGTDALVCALLALQIEPEQEVLVPAFGFVAAAEAVVRVGARVVFVDVRPDDLGPDLDSVRGAITSKTVAIIVVHLFGQAIDLQPIKQVVGNIAIIEDAAQAIGTRIRKRHVGSRADVAILSFFPAKSLGAAGDAGAVLTVRDDIAQRVRSVRVHGAMGPYKWESIGGNYRMDALQAAILKVKLQALPERLRKRIAMAEQLKRIVQHFGVHVMQGCSVCEPTFAPFVMRFDGRDKRDAVMERLRGYGIDARVHYPVTIPDSGVFAGARAARYPNAVAATEQVLSVPCCPELLPEEWERLTISVTNTLGACMRA